jgi:hypothetical protein
MNIDRESPAPKLDPGRPILAATFKGACFGALILGGMVLSTGLIVLGVGNGIGGICGLGRPSLLDLLAMLGGIALSAVTGAITGGVIKGTLAVVQSRRRR